MSESGAVSTNNPNVAHMNHAKDGMMMVPREPEAAPFPWRLIEEAEEYKDGTLLLLWGFVAGEVNGPCATPMFAGCGSWDDGKSDYPGDDWLLGCDRQEAGE